MPASPRMSEKTEADSTDKRPRRLTSRRSLSLVVGVFGLATLLEVLRFGIVLEATWLVSGLAFAVCEDRQARGIWVADSWDDRRWLSLAVTLVFVVLVVGSLLLFGS